MKYVISNTNRTQGIIIEAKDADEAFKIGNKEFYSPYPNKKELTNCQPYDINCQKKADGYLIHSKLEFNFSGSGSGWVTIRNTSIHNKPNERQKDFIGNSKIDFIKFY